MLPSAGRALSDIPSEALSESPLAPAGALPLVELRGVSKRFVKSLDSSMRIANLFGAGMREEIVEIFEISGLMELFSVYDTVETAAASRPH